MALTFGLLAACGGDPADPDMDPGDGTVIAPMRATIDGVAWAAPESNVQAFFIASSSTYGLTGADLTGNVGSRALLLNLQAITEPGTYDLGSINPFRYANTSIGTGVWETGPGASGSVTVTTVTPTHIVGTFSFTAVPAPSNRATNVVSVTDGSFDVTLVP
jgi:hypothetical protein